ncbi:MULTISPECIES: triphosphoribosyl-dephospho-CoA synthase MdcB [unclassified Enterococcus]|uniref:triphosphoribosyl-dephospho-CoA synthase MdcB n=1 Tax=unclassified Enterococcus TaxID=2608891 RepID=UPI0013EAC259|nr:MULTISPECIES: triphosphoribosyl-dephospho-CoA synthase MdcB [unclassified Enterococcus]
MENDERKKAMTRQLASLVEEALIAEVTLSPKPGLVDALDTGAHSDMDVALFLKSARTLTPFFEKMAQAAWLHPIDQNLREAIAEIGREAEHAMLTATNGVNTHKGAIWAMGLLISVTAQKISDEQSFSVTEVLEDVSKLAAFPDTKYRAKKATHGHKVKKKYGVNGAYEEAVLGYPHIKLALEATKKLKTDSPVQKQLHILLVLMSSLDDTCVLHRSDQETLIEMQTLAHAASRSMLPNRDFTKLLDFCQSKQISPGGSADLLSASLFLLEVEKFWIADARISPILLHEQNR